MIEVPKKKITLEGLKNALKLYSYIKPPIKRLVNTIRTQFVES